jgi:hypothetical protein
MSDLPPILPSTPPPVPSSKPGLPLLVKVFLVFLALLMAYMAVQAIRFVSYARQHPRQSPPGEAAFRDANRKIISGPAPAYGNTRPAEDLAEEFSTRVQAARAEFFTKGSGDHSLLGTLAKGRFFTYCRLDTNACVFLIHVPELRHFTPEAKAALGDIAWTTGQELVRKQVSPPPRRLVVGVKGELWYDPILIGDYVPELKTPADGIKTRASGIDEMELFYPFFKTDAK